MCRNFDRAFLNLYPNFVEKFNALLNPQSRYTPEEGRLNTELRIFALIRLGVSDVNQIADFLRCSPQTIYNYKSKIKKAALNGGDNFEDMIAYVDENGILHTTPQDVKPKTEIDVSQIEISTPKQEEMEILPSTGRVEYFTASKGYGFIKDADSGEKYFFHISSAPDTIAEGDKVTFEIERGTRGLAAVRISIINKQ